MSTDITLRTASSVPDTENSAEFHQGMVDRMCVSYHKYGSVADARGKVDEVESLILRLAKYMGTSALRAAVDRLPEVRKTGNTEFLMDVANIAMIEFMHQGPRKFRPTDASASPGRVWIDEFDGSIEISQRANDGSI